MGGGGKKTIFFFFFFFFFHTYPSIVPYQIMETCACPGCDQPGTNKCGACQTKFYCGPKCQTADWPQHKEECPVHLRKIGIANLKKAKGFYGANNWSQTSHYSDLAATKLKQLKNRPVEIIDEALRCKFNALTFMSRHREALECAKEWYCLYLTKHTHPPAIEAGFALIESCLYNGEFADAVLYAHTTWETLTLSHDSHIPESKRQQFIAQGAHYFAKATFGLASSGWMPAEEKQEAGREAITLARRALKMDTQLHGADSEPVAHDMGLLASVLEYFNDVDDDEVPRLLEQANAIFACVYGSLSPNAATGERNLGSIYNNRATRAQTVSDLDRCVVNLELALPRYREAARIFGSINHMERAGDAAHSVIDVEERLRQIKAVRFAANKT